MLLTASFTILTLTLCNAGALPQEPLVDRNSIWVDTVNRGELPILVHGAGTLLSPTQATLSIPEAQARNIEAGQAAAVDLKPGVVNAHVESVSGVNSSGMVGVVVNLDNAPTTLLTTGRLIDGTIWAGSLSNVVWVGRPVVSQPESEGVLFKLDPDGRFATRVHVMYGRSSINKIEVRCGLQPGDQVILTDLSTFQGKDRVRLN